LLDTDVDVVIAMNPMSSLQPGLPTTIAERVERNFRAAFGRRFGREARRLRDKGVDVLLVQLPPLRGERHHAVARNSVVDRFECGRDDVDAEHHPRPTAVRVIVDLAGCQWCRVAVVEDAKLELGPENRRERTALAHPREGVGHEREDVEAHDAEP